MSDSSRSEAVNNGNSLVLERPLDGDFRVRALDLFIESLRHFETSSIQSSQFNLLNYKNKFSDGLLDETAVIRRGIFVRFP